MRCGQIVKVRGRLAVVLRVTPRDIHNGTLVERPGIYPFAGYWYGKDPLSIHSYGKILEGDPNKSFLVVGQARDHFQIKGLKI